MIPAIATIAMATTMTIISESSVLELLPELLAGPTGAAVVVTTVGESVLKVGANEGASVGANVGASLLVGQYVG